jgi:iron-sulfur cluster insertion protein
MDNATISISENAARQVQKLKTAQGNEALRLRIAVLTGGCSGFSYVYSLDETTQPDDKVFEEHGVTLVVDEASLGLLAGCVLDYKTDLMGSAFAINNPNATATCGCGSSFAA